MSWMTIFLQEWKHFIRSPFKLIAFVLFSISAIYALHNGAALYHEQTEEIAKIRDKAEDEKKSTLAYYEKGEKGPANRPWIDVTTPFWALLNTPVYHFKSPSPALVYSIGQAEQYGFYKRVTLRSSPYDADLAEEIANPERLQLGTLDFSFVALYLMPLLLLICLYNIKGLEADKGFLPLIYTQTTSGNGWLISRVGFYVALHVLLILALMFYGGSLTNIFKVSSSAFWQFFAVLMVYLLLWSVAFTLLLRFGNSSRSNALKMIGLWIVFSFVIPAIVHQWVSIKYPANLLTQWIDSQRDDRDKLFDQPDSLIQEELNVLFPDIPKTAVYQDKEKRIFARNRSGAALENELKKNSIAPIEANIDAKNELIRFTYWFNPIIYFQNKLNTIAQTHFEDYKGYRTKIQSAVDKQLEIMVMDTWNAVELNKEKYLEYNQLLN